MLKFTNGTKVFSIYSRNNNNEEEIAVVKNAFFCLEAMIFGVLWALYQRLWYISISTLIIQVLLTYYANTLGSLIVDFIGIVIILSFALLGYDMIEYNLIKKGYTLQTIVYAMSEEEAELQYLSNKKLKNIY